MEDESDLIEDIYSRLDEKVNTSPMAKLGEKGLTPAVASVILIAITVTTAGTFYAIQKTSLSQTKNAFDQVTKIDLEKSLRIEQCYQKQGFTNVILRNSGDKALNFTYVNSYLNNKPINVKQNKNLIDPKESFEVNTTENLTYEKDQLTFVLGSNMVSHICQDDVIRIGNSNKKPVSLFTYNPSNPVTGETINFDASGSSDPEGNLVDWEWDWDNDGNYETNGKTATHSYSNSGDKTVTLRVIDGEGQVDTSSQTVQIDSPNGPTVSLNLNHGASNSDRKVEADLSATQGTTSINNCNLDWGDGNTQTITNYDGSETHTYNSDGTYTATYTCTDTNGYSDSASDTITVNIAACGTNSAPTASFSKNENGCQVDTFSGSTDTDGNIVLHKWDWENDGTYDTSGSTSSWTYGSSGTYTIKYYVEDSCGASDTTTKTVTVSCTSNSPPTASFTYTPTNPSPGEVIGFDASGSSDSDGSINSYSWDWDNDGNYETNGKTATHSYSNTGDKTVRLKVTDNDGATDTTSQTITVTSSGGGGGGPPPSALREKGGSGNAEIGLLTTPGTAQIKGEVTNPTTGATELCIGNNCPDQTGSSTSLDPDIYVNESGDKMTGTLYTDGFKPDTNLCLGSGCATIQTTSGSALSSSNKDTVSQFKITIPDVKPNSGGSVCLGKDC